MPDETVKETMSTESESQKGAKEPSPFNVYSIDGTLMYSSDQSEFDDCFYSIIALGLWTKTFSIGTRLKLTFTTISETKKMDLLKGVKLWSDSEQATTQMFDQFLTKMNLSRYLTTIEIDGSLINLREGEDKDKIELLSGQAEQALSLYGNWLYVFQEIIRRSLTSQVAIKNS